MRAPGLLQTNTVLAECYSPLCYPSRQQRHFARSIPRAPIRERPTSQVAPLDMFKEVNTKCNLPAQARRPGAGLLSLTIVR